MTAPLARPGRGPGRAPETALGRWRGVLVWAVALVLGLDVVLELITLVFDDTLPVRFGWLLIVVFGWSGAPGRSMPLLALIFAAVAVLGPGRGGRPRGACLAVAVLLTARAVAGLARQVASGLDVEGLGNPLMGEGVLPSLLAASLAWLIFAHAVAAPAAGAAPDAGAETPPAVAPEPPAHRRPTWARDDATGAAWGRAGAAAAGEAPGGARPEPRGEPEDEAPRSAESRWSANRWAGSEPPGAGPSSSAAAGTEGIDPGPRRAPDWGI